MTEWRDIPGYPDYKASEDGQVMSFRSCPDGRILNQHVSNNGYMRVSVKHRNGKQHTVGIHRLVALAFLPNPDSLPEVNHKNGIKTDNKVENLEWCTSSANHLHAYRELGKVSAAKGQHFNREAKLSPIEVRIIRQTSLSIEELGEYFGVSPTTVFNARRHRTYKYID